MRSWVVCAEDTDRFQAQLEGHPKLRQMIKAYEQKQQELKAIKAAKKAPSKAPKKRKRITKESAVTNNEVSALLPPVPMCVVLQNACRDAADKFW